MAAAPRAESLALYTVHCPDVLLLDVPGRPDWGGTCRVDVDGRIALGEDTRLDVDGRTPSEIAEAVAREAGLPPGTVHVEVAEYNSQQLLLFGEVSGLQRAVPYRGPERVVDLLRRVGGISPEASHHDVRVVRAHIAEGGESEVFPVELSAILLENDQDTNVVLQPFDRIYIGQSRRSVLACCIPPWLRGLCRMSVNLLKGDKPPPLTWVERREKRAGRHLSPPPPPHESDYGSWSIARGW
jgi:protein involved in polysaccharide export with SLBB domain